jgi:hypothetical protein
LNGEKKNLSAKRYLALLLVVVTMTASVLVPLLVPAGWNARLPIVAAVALGMSMPPMAWMIVLRLNRKKEWVGNNPIITRIMTISAVARAAIALLDAWLLPSFVPLFLGTNLSASLYAPFGYLSNLCDELHQ